jgi:hypothetical protein
MNRIISAIVLLLPLNLPMLAQESMGQGTAATPGRGRTDKLTPCRVPDVEEEVLCGRYEVYENRAAGTGRKIDRPHFSQVIPLGMSRLRIENQAGDGREPPHPGTYGRAGGKPLRESAGTYFGRTPVAAL